MKLPVITFNIDGSTKFSDEMVKNPFNPAYNPNKLLGFTDQMNLFQRLMNSAMTIIDQIAYQ